ncbi:MAG: TolC family protein [Pseudobdellovibrionaceae bacterium]
MILCFSVVSLAQNKTEIVLSQKIVAEMVLAQSLQAKEIDSQFQQYRLAPAQALSALDWKLTAESGYEYDKSENLTSTTTSAVRYQRYKNSVDVAKSLITGTDLTLGFARVSQKADPDTYSASSSIRDHQTLDTFSFTIEQALLYNFFGLSSRAKINAAETEYKAQSLLRADQLQELVLKGIRQFWSTYVAQENFREALASRELYKKLVESVKRKNGLGYTNPGEYSQVQAEFEGREQNVKKTSQIYLKNLEDLSTLLNLPADSEVKFDVPKALPPVPELAKKDQNSLRAIRSQKLKISAAEEQLKSSKSTSYPALNLVGQVYSTGVEDTAEGSYTEAVNGTSPKYYVGLKFVYTFGSGLQTEDLINKKMVLNQEQYKLQRQLSEVKDKEQQSLRGVQAAFSLAQSMTQQKIYREKAVQELTRSFTQGRSDISVLIDAMNKFFTSEVGCTQAIGDYQIALNEWAASRDELIPDMKENN